MPNTLKLKTDKRYNAVDLARRSPARGKTKTVEFARKGDARPHAPRKSTVTPMKPPHLAFEEIFGIFKPEMRSVGENIMIIRAWMSKNGYPAIPEHFTIPQFASALQWSMRPRHSWSHFYSSQVTDARKFLRTVADALLPQMMQAGA